MANQTSHAGGNPHNPPQWIQHLEEYEMLSQEVKDRLSTMQGLRLSCLTPYLHDEEGLSILRFKQLEYFRNQVSSISSSLKKA